MTVRLARVGDVATQVRGVSYGKEDASDSARPGYLPVLRAGNITEHGLVFDDLVFVPAARVASKQRIRRHDLVIAASSGSLDVVGKAARALTDFDGGFGAFCKVLRPGADVDPEYFAQFFKTDTYRRRVSALASGANINNLRNEHLDDMLLPLPSLAEQRRIADILDRADALRAKRRDAIALLDTLTQSIFVNMFGGAEGRWPSATIGDVASPENGSVRTGPFGSQLLHGEFTQSGVAVLGIDNVDNQFRWAARRFISDQKYASLKRYTVHPGDVIITIMGTCGRCAIVPDDVPRAINTKHLCCITLDRSKCLPEFLHAYFLRHPAARRYLEQKAKGAIMAGLNMGIIKAMPIPLVPIEAQEEFARRVAAVDKLKAAHRASLAQLDALFASLQHRAFRGEL